MNSVLRCRFGLRNNPNKLKIKTNRKPDSMIETKLNFAEFDFVT